MRKYIYVIQLLSGPTPAGVPSQIQLSKLLQVDSANMDSNQDMDVDVDLKYAIVITLV